MNKNFLLLIAAVASVIAYFGQLPDDGHISPDVPQVAPHSAVRGLEQAAKPPTEYDPEQAILRHARDAEVEGAGTVIKVLHDDLDGSRHQKFLLRLPSGHIILIAHNIDLAPRIDNLREGDAVGFHGEYVWNEKGGVIHWTHLDPSGRHQAGWLKHSQHTYQ